MMNRCQECSFLVGADVDECPRCGARLSQLERVFRWLRIFVVAFFLLGIFIASPAIYAVTYFIDRAGYIVEWWHAAIVGAFLVGLIATMITMQRSRTRAEALDARLSMEMPAVKPDLPGVGGGDEDGDGEDEAAAPDDDDAKE